MRFSHRSGRAGWASSIAPATPSSIGRCVKVLPDAVARDADRRARFAREAHLAALNHPHIAGIYGVAQEQGVTALALSLVECR